MSRQRDEVIVIGNDVTVTVIDIIGGKVRLGVSAPSAVRVDRKEVRDAIERERREARRGSTRNGNNPAAAALMVKRKPPQPGPVRDS